MAPFKTSSINLKASVVRQGSVILDSNTYHTQLSFLYSDIFLTLLFHHCEGYQAFLFILQSSFFLNVLFFIIKNITHKLFSFFLVFS